MALILNQAVLDFIKDAYSALKDDGSNTHFIKYRDINDYDKVIEYMMLKDCWYYGEWVVFKGNSVACIVDESFMESLINEIHIDHPSIKGDAEVKGDDI